MKIQKIYIALGLVIAFGLFLELAAHAEVLNQRTQIMVSAPIQIPGKVLPAGTYVFQQEDPDADPNIVQISSADGTISIMLQAIPVERDRVTGDTSLTFAQPVDGNPPALLTWFYPGELTGYRFMYPQRQEQALTQSKQKTIVGNEILTSAGAAGE